MVNNEVGKAKESYYKDALNTNKGNSQNTWRIINELLSKKSKNCSVKEIVHNGTSIYYSNDLSDAFNDHFSSVGPRLANEIPDNEDCPSHLDYLSDSDGRFELNTTIVHQMSVHCYQSYANPKRLAWIKYRQDFFVNVPI
jgi:hypothetical protein